MNFAIIGCGVQGSTFAAQLVNGSGATKVLLLDYDKDRADTVAQKLNQRAVQKSSAVVISALRADASDTDEVASLLTGCDVLLNATMPDFNLPLMKACLASKTNYLDLYAEAAEDPSDIAGSLEEQFTLHEAFKDAGLIAIPCVGVNPGWIDVIADRELAAWDEVHDVTIRELEWIDSDELLVTGPSNLLMRMFLESPQQIVAGQSKPIDLVDGEEVYEFPAPVGPQGVLPVSYNDASLRVAAHNNAPSGRVVERFAVLSGGKSMKDILLTCAAEQLAAFDPDAEKADVFAALGSSLTSVTDLDFGQAKAEGRIRNAAWVSSIEVTGVLNGVTTVRTFECASTMDETLERVSWAPPGALVTTALPLELALAIASGRIGDAGVLNLSGISEAQKMVDDLGRWGVRVSEK
jgi:hypothetical protein